MLMVGRITRILLACVLGVCLSQPAWGQLKLKGNPETSAFPTVSFKVNHRSPVAIDSTDFSLKEDEKAVPFKMTSLDVPDSSVDKTVLILWEYLPSKKREGQNKYFRQLILSALPDLLGEGDRVNVATFAWTDKAGGKTLNYLGQSFGTDTATLAQAVREAKAPSGQGISEDHGSELYPSLSEGIEELAAQAENARVLVILSAEYPNIYNPGGEVSMVTAKAKDADVAVYNIRYKVMAPKYNLNDVAKGTYGQSFEVKPDAPSVALDTLLGFMDDAAYRSLGQDYQFEFTTGAGKDGQAHGVQVSVGKESLMVNFNSPKPTFGDWVSGHPVLAALLGVLLLAVIVGAVYFIRKRLAVSKAQEGKLQAVEAQHQAAEQRIQQQQRALQNLNDEQQRKQSQSEAERRRAEADEEARMLMAEMFSNGKSPRFSVITDGRMSTVTLPAPVATVGRDSASDIRIDHPTLSRTHFQVVYQEGKYTLIDLGSTNGTLLNGQRVNAGELRHGDVVKAGEVTMNFYL